MDINFVVYERTYSKSVATVMEISKLTDIINTKHSLRQLVPADFAALLGNTQSIARSRWLSKLQFYNYTTISFTM